MSYNLVLFQLEVIVLIISILYILYYFFDKSYGFVLSIRKILGLSKTKIDRPISTIEINEDREVVPNFSSKTDHISPDDQNKIAELLKKIKLNISKGEYDLAKNLIVEGLTIDKFNMDLNLELAGIYLIEENYSKSEFIYKDLLLVHTENFDIFKKLAYALTMQEKYDLAIEMYKKAYELKDDDIDTINMLAGLYYYKGLYLDAIIYLKIFLKDNQKHIENNILLGSCYKNIGKILDSVNTFQKVLEIDPYNLEAKNEIKELESLEYVVKE